MKKLLIASVSVLALSTGAAYAQSASDVEQIGNSNQATINQQSGGGSNTSYVWQGYGGTGNAAYSDIANIIDPAL